MWRIEEVLDLYAESYDPFLPVVCLDERPCQLIDDLRASLPVKLGHIERFDSAYERGRGLLGAPKFEPLTGLREMTVTKGRRKQEFAHSMRRLAQEYYPQEDLDGLG